MKKFLFFLLSAMTVFLFGCKEEILAPSSLSVNISKEIELKWGGGENAEFYRVYRLEDGDKDFRFIDDTKAVSYIDKTAKEDKNYIYKVTSVRGNKESEGAVSEKVRISSASDGANSVFSAPIISSVSKMDKYTNVVIFSSDNENCVFQVERSGSLGGGYVNIGETDETAFYDETANGGSFYYRVTAVSKNGERAVSTPQRTGKNQKASFRVPVIMYHEFITQEDLDKGVAFDEYAIWQEEFESDLKWLKENGYQTITTKQLADYLEGKGKMPQKPIIITADDGKYGVYKNAYPLLDKYDMTMSLALIGYEIDNATQDPAARSESEAPYCTWEEIAEMANSGHIEMISHTQRMHIFSHNNRSGANCAEGESLESFLPAAQGDFIRFNNNLKKNTGKTTVAMAYPYSKRSVTSDKAWIKSGYKVLLGGDDPNDRKTLMNYYVAEAGVNSKSAVARRLVRMTNVPLKNYIQEAIAHDA